MGKEKTLNRASDDYGLAMEYFSAGDIEKGCDAIQEQKELHIQQYPDLEAKLNGMGYVHLRQDDINQALTIFKLNVDLFPESSNVYDSYGEACMMNGELDLAVTNYKKSLELNPENNNAVTMLKRIKKQKTK